MPLIKLRCRNCGILQDFDIPSDVVPPKNFLCRNCAGEKSITEGRTVSDLKKTELAKRVHREGRGVNVIPDEPGQSSIAEWHKRNPVWRKVYRQLHRAGYRRRPNEHTPPGEVIAAWFARVANFDWRCADCDLELTEGTVHCFRPFSGQVFRVDECLPLCRSCTKRRAAGIRWDREKSSQDAEDNELYKMKGVRCVAPATAVAPNP